MNLGQIYEPLGVGLDYFASDAQRCAYNDNNGQATQLTRQLAYSDPVQYYHVGMDGKRYSTGSTMEVGIRPAFTIRWSDTYVDPEQNEDGSYNLITEEVGD